MMIRSSESEVNAISRTFDDPPRHLEMYVTFMMWAHFARNICRPPILLAFVRGVVREGSSHHSDWSKRLQPRIHEPEDEYRSDQELSSRGSQLHQQRCQGEQNRDRIPDFDLPIIDFGLPIKVEQAFPSLIFIYIAGVMLWKCVKAFSLG
jgi:hypothetical protein